MGCSGCSRKKNVSWKKTKDTIRKSTTPSPEDKPIFNSVIGRLFYFLLVLIICLTPIPNISLIYLYFKAIFHKKKKNKDGKHKNKDNS